MLLPDAGEPGQKKRSPVPFTWSPDAAGGYHAGDEVVNDTGRSGTRLLRRERNLQVAQRDRVR